MTHTLSIVIPVFNERDEIAATIDAASSAAAAASGLDVEIVVADDGSTDGTADAARSAAGSVPVRVVSLPENRGRFAARSAGLADAEGDLVLYLDNGVLLEPGSLAFVAGEIETGRDVWNGHTHMAARGPLSRFWSVVSALAFRDYLEAPRTTSFGEANFDRYPKGLGCFLAPRGLLLQAFGAFRSYYADSRHANDDTPIIRFVAGRRPIWISPQFDCTYFPRTAVRSFLRHAFHRGIVFVDGHGRRESRFFPLVVSFYPLSVAAAVVVVVEPLTAVALLLATAAVAALAAAWLRRGWRDTASFAAVAPLYLVAHGAGMWRGLALAVAHRLRRRP